MGGQRNTIETFIQKAKNLHGDAYDYSLITEYKNATTHLPIICPIHGVYHMNAHMHLKGNNRHQGCRLCGYDRAKSLTTLDVNVFEKQLNAKYGGSITFDKNTYIRASCKVDCYCKVHNRHFKMQPSRLICSAHGCPTCGHEKAFQNKIYKTKYDTASAIEESIKIWGIDRWGYDKLVYSNLETEVTLLCKHCNLEFNQTIKYHLQKFNGCHNCKMINGWDKASWIQYCESKSIKYSVVYIAKCYTESKDEEFVKIGLSSQIDKRFYFIPYEKEFIQLIWGLPGETYTLEKRLRKLFKQYKYKPLKKFGGYTECFNLNILQDPNFQIFLK